MTQKLDVELKNQILEDQQRNIKEMKEEINIIQEDIVVCKTEVSDSKEKLKAIQPLQQDMISVKTEIVDHKEKIIDIENRHIPLNIRGQYPC